MLAFAVLLFFLHGMVKGNHFSFNVIDSKISQISSITFCDPGSMTGSNEAVVLAKELSASVIYFPNTSATYLGGLYQEEVVNMSYLADPANENDYKKKSSGGNPAPMTYIFFFKRFNSTHCYLNRLMTLAANMSNAGNSSEKDRSIDVIHISTKSSNYPPIPCDGDEDKICFNRSIKLLPANLGVKEIATYFLVDDGSLLPGYFDDPLFYRLLWIGNRAEVGKTPFKFSMDALNLGWHNNYFKQTYGGLTYYNYADYYTTRLATDEYGYGYKIQKDLAISYKLEHGEYSAAHFPSITLYIYGLNDTLMTNLGLESIELNLESQSGDSGKRDYARFKVTIKSTGPPSPNPAQKFIEVTLELTYVHQLHLANPVSIGPLVLTTPLTKKHLMDNAPVAGGDCITVFMAVATNYLKFPQGADDNFVGEAVGSLTIFPLEVENIDQTNFDSSKTGVNRFTYTISLDFVTPKDGRTYYDYPSCSFNHTSPTGGTYDVRLRQVEYLMSLVDYSRFDSDYLITNFGDFGYSLHPILPELNYQPQYFWTYRNQTKGSPDCFSQWADSGYCEYCNDGYAPDYNDFLNTRKYCWSKADCNTADNYMVWIDGGLTNSDTRKALCQSCPVNCASCNVTDCLSCSTHSSLFNDSANNNYQRCRCTVTNCYLCVNTECDLCNVYDPNLKLGYMLVLATPRNCTWGTNYTCPPRYGYDNTYQINGLSKPHFPACIGCLIHHCNNCSNSASTCHGCEAPFTYLNQALALPPDNASFINCTDTHQVYLGLYEDNVTRKYTPCTPNCQICYNDPTDCEECVSGYSYYALNKTCLSNAWCDAWDSKLYLDLNGSRPECKDCVDDCLFCLDGTTCINCTSSYVVYDSILGFANTSKCVPVGSCNPTTNTFLGTVAKVNGTNFTSCLDCIPYCQSCADTTTCIQCKANYYYQPTFKECLTYTQCQNSNYMSYNDTTAANPTCVDCGRGCKLCNNDTFCEECNSSTALYHLDNNLCVESTDCGQVLHSYPFSRFCKTCKLGCELCSNDTNCWKCLAGFIDTDNISCVSQCRSLTTNLNATHCIDCPKNCQNCTYDPLNLTRPLQCDTCLSGFYFDTDQNCTQCIRKKQFLIDDICHICEVPLCLKCNATVQTCIDCEDQYYVNETNGCSLCEAPLIYTVNKTCLPCQVDNCENCDASNLLNCIKCKEGYFKQGLACVPRFFRVLKHSFVPDSLAISIRFEDKIKDFNLSNIYCTVKDVANSSQNSSQAETNLTINSFKIDPTSAKIYYLKISELPKISELDMNLTFINTFGVLSMTRDTFTLNPNNKTLVFDRISRFIPANSELSKETAAALTTTTTIVVIIGSIIAFNYAVILMKIYQMMEFMLLYNVAYPHNFKYFITLFKTSDPLSMLPDIFAFLYDDTCAELGDRFVLQDMGCQFFNNCGSTVFLFCIYFAMRILLSITYRFTKKKEGKIARFVAKVHRSACGPEGLFVLLTTFDMDFYLGSFTNNKYYAGDKIKTLQNVVNNLVSQTFIFAYPLVIGFYYIKTRNIYYFKEGKIDMSEEHVQRYEFLAEGRKDANWYHKYADVFSMAKNYMICLLVVGYYDHPHVQVISTTLLILATMILEIRYRPKSSKMENIVSIVIWVSYFGLDIGFLFILFGSERVSKESIYTYVGYPMIFFFGCLIVINFLPIIINLGMRLYRAIQKCRNKNKFQKIEPKKKADAIELQESKLNQRSELLDNSMNKNKEDNVAPPLEKVTRKIGPGERREVLRNKGPGVKNEASKKKVEGLDL